MKINKYTSALVALGVLSLAGVAHATTTIFLTGSTAARPIIFSAATTPGQIFTGASTILSTAPNNTKDAGKFAIEGNIAGVGDTILNCSFTGSEAGIAATAGQPLKQSLPLDPNPGSPFNLPGTPLPSFLVAPWTGATATHAPDLSMADTSQVVSQTPISVAHLVDYGIVGVIPFTFMKAYDSTAGADAFYGRLVSVTAAAVNQNLVAGFAYDLNNYTGNPADVTVGTAIIGRNLGSGTRANFLLNAAEYGLNVAVNQYAYGATYNNLYPASAVGTLTFGVTPAGTTPIAAPYGAGQTLQAVGNDGFDSGGSVQKTMNTDMSGQGIIPIGYVGMVDAQYAINPALLPPQGSAVVPNAPVGNVAVPLAYNGVYESDNAVVNGQYTFWGSEHLLGAVGQASNSAAGQTAAAIVGGIALNIAAAGNAPGNILSNPQGQSILIPTSIMLVSRSHGDSGFPFQVAAGGF
jgi:hypothetical protein